MEFKVREVEGGEEKSLAQREQEVLDQHEKQQEETVVEDTQEQTSQEDTLTDDRVLEFLGNRYGRKINSFDELMTERDTQEEMPEDVSAYLLSLIHI